MTMSDKVTTSATLVGTLIAGNKCDKVTVHLMTRSSRGSSTGFKTLTYILSTLLYKGYHRNIVGTAVALIISYDCTLIC